MFVEISRGRSFKGLAQYCLHDVNGKTDDRVLFVETRNLGTDNPQAAWRIMAARHYLQDELKQKAGVGRGGAKDGKPVGHLLISWKKEEAEAENLNHLGMLNAANGALRAIGASQHQALIIGHTDTPHPHCHIIINLIGDDGRLKKNWKEKQKLSKFALKREIEIHGEPIVKTREKNWLDREAGETPEPVKKKPRHLYELDKAAKKCPQIKAFAAQHHKQLAELERAKAAAKVRHKRHQAQLQWCLQERNRRTQAATEQKIRASKTAVRKAYRQSWHEFLNEQEAERREFAKNERNLKGSLSNAMQLIDWKQVLRWKRQPDQLRLGDVFRILTSEATRREKLKERQQAAQDKLRARQRQEEKDQELALQKEQTKLLREQRRDYLRKATGMKQRQSDSHVRLKEQQQDLTRQRNLALEAFRERERQKKLVFVRGWLQDRNMGKETAKEADRTPLLPAKEQDLAQKPKPLAAEFDQAVPAELQAERPGRTRRERKERQPRQPRVPRAEPRVDTEISATMEASKPKTRPIDILPQDENAGQVAKQIDDFEERMQKRFAEWQQDRDRDQGDRER